MNNLSKRAAFALFLTMILLFGLFVITSRFFSDGSDWVTFQNSPHVYTNGVLDGGRMVDRAGTLVLQTSGGRQYAETQSLRKAMLHLTGDTQGNIVPFLMDEYSDSLIGYDFINGAYNMGDAGGEMKLSICAEAQTTALKALDGRKGVVGVYNYKTGEILCAVSAPTFDPTDVPDVQADPKTYEGVYVNRFLHTTYTPGSTFKLLTATAALENIKDIEDRRFECTGSIEIGGETVICNGVHGNISFEQAVQRSCNVAFSQIAVELGKDKLAEYVKKIGVTDRLSFDGTRTRAGSFDVSEASEFQLGWAGIGQYTNQINPCQYMTFVGAIANGGTAAKPYLVKSVTYGDSEKYAAETTMLDRVMDEATAERLADIMHGAVVNNYGEWYFSGYYAGAKSGTAQHDGEMADSLFVGFTQSPTLPVAFVIIVEGGGTGITACAPIIQQVLDALCAAMS